MVGRESDSQQPKITIDGVRVEFPGRRSTESVVAADDVCMSVNEGEFVSVIGPSGCGKSTILNVVSGLIAPTAGEVYVDGSPVDGINADVGYMFARDGLLPWRTAQANVEFGLELRGVKDRASIARKWLGLVGLAGFEDHYRHELSQGMRQRVAVARTFASDPDILLMDEPFGALDAQTRLQLQTLFLRIWEAQRKTVVFVTHDLTEAILLSDRIVVMSGRPGTVKDLVDVGIPRPRDSAHLSFGDDFRKLYDHLWKALDIEAGAVDPSADLNSVAQDASAD